MKESKTNVIGVILFAILLIALGTYRRCGQSSTKTGGLIKAQTSKSFSKLTIDTSENGGSTIGLLTGHAVNVG